MTISKDPRFRGKENGPLFSFFFSFFFLFPSAATKNRSSGPSERGRTFYPFLFFFFPPFFPPELVMRWAALCRTYPYSSMASVPFALFGFFSSGDRNGRSPLPFFFFLLSLRGRRTHHRRVAPLACRLSGGTLFLFFLQTEKVGFFFHPLPKKKTVLLSFYSSGQGRNLIPREIQD